MCSQVAVCQDESTKESAGRGTCRASLLGLSVRSSSCPMGESPPRRLSGVCGGPVPAGDDMAPVLVGAPAELALIRIAAVLTEALGLEVSCSSCACSRYIPDTRSLACVNRMQSLAAQICAAAFR